MIGRQHFGTTQVGVGLTLAVVFGFWLSRPAVGDDSDSVNDRTPEQIFLSDCAVCHGSNAHGTRRAPSLEGVGAAAVDFMLSTGRMPLERPGRSQQPGRPVQPQPGVYQSDPGATTSRHEPAYDEATIAALVDYVTGLAGGDGPAIPTVREGDVGAGGVLYREQCAACHSWAGDGGALFRREAPALHDATPVQIAEAIRVGPGTMPRFGPAALTPDEVNDVVAYVRYLREPDDRGGHPLGHLGPVSEGALALLGIGGLLLFLRWVGERG